MLSHLFLPHWLALRPFPKPALERIGQAIAASEKRHRGELRFVIEGPLPIGSIRAGTRARAEALFSALKVWDTQENSGVLIYVQLVDRAIEIVADRGIAARVAQAEWDAICRAMEKAFSEGRHLDGALAAIQSVTSLLAQHFPAGGGDNPNELPDSPVVMP